MLNAVSIQGRLVERPELRSTGNGTSVTAFRIAVDRDFRNQKTNELEADFFSVVCWRATAEFVVRYFDKGQMAAIQGRLQSRNYTDKTGNSRTAVEIVADHVYFAGGKKQTKEPGDPESPYGPAKGAEMARRRKNEFDELTEDDGELPF